MESKRKEVIVLILLIIAIFSINYPSLNNLLENFLNIGGEVHVDRIIDGDTIESNSTSIRLLGINSPERGEFYYNEAKEFLEEEILNKTVGLKYGKERYDKYDRILAYVFLDNTNINVKIIENGFANYYFPSGKDKYSNALVSAWESCIENQINLCEPSQHFCSECISINPDNITNTCGFDCNISGWQIKGEGRKDFIFSDEILSSGEEISFELELTETGDTLFLRDSERKLVIWEEY